MASSRLIALLPRDSTSPGVAAPGPATQTAFRTSSRSLLVTFDVMLGHPLGDMAEVAADVVKVAPAPGGWSPGCGGPGGRRRPAQVRGRRSSLEALVEVTVGDRLLPVGVADPRGEQRQNGPLRPGGAAEPALEQRQCLGAARVQALVDRTRGCGCPRCSSRPWSGRATASPAPGSGRCSPGAAPRPRCSGARCRRSSPRCRAARRRWVTCSRRWRFASSDRALATRR